MNKQLKAKVATLSALTLLLGIGIGIGQIASAAFQNESAAEEPASANLQGQTEGEGEMYDRNAGILVTYIQSGNEAEQPKLIRGDIIVAINGEAVTDEIDLFQQFKTDDGTEIVDLTIWRGETLTEAQTDLASLHSIGLQRGSFEKEGIFFDKYGIFDHPELYASKGFDGALAIEVSAGSAAQDAGIQAGDIILAVDDQTITIDNDLAAVIAAYAPGDRISLKIKRGEEEISVDVTLGEHPDDAGTAQLGVRYAPNFSLPHLSFNGDEFMPVTPFFDEEFHFDGSTKSQGAVVAHVVADSAAENAGIQAGDIITEIEGKAVESANQLAERIKSLQPGDAVQLSVLTDGETEAQSITAILGEDENGAAFLGVHIGGFFSIHKEFDLGDSPPDGSGFEMLPEGVFPDIWLDPSDSFEFDFEFDLPPSDEIPAEIDANA